jgi:hypothetical protein
VKLWITLTLTEANYTDHKVRPKIGFNPQSVFLSKHQIEI